MEPPLLRPPAEAVRRGPRIHDVGVGCLNEAAITADLEIVSERDPRRWRSPGRVVFHALASPALEPVARRLRDRAR